ncbi:helix-turn-helix domain-containing protein [Fundicoccus sp. Sow4_F4]|uniref:helix-turn-helix domain-containing protein n=1 Tax=Fundicoccus sp. Sow4_F4 TaxID=3438783 RepID=UPI003F90AC2E
MAHNTISFYESGTNEPEQDMLFKLAKAFEISINDLFPPTKKSDKRGYKSELLAAHIDDDVTEDQMDDILKYIDFIKSQNK